MKKHEEVSAAVIRFHPEVREALGEENAESIGDLLVQKGAGEKRSIERDVIAGPADADKFDYLLRDSHFCGVEYGRYDLAKVIESSREVEEFGISTALGFHEDAVFALEEMVLARHHMHRQVYAHKTRLATDLMLVKAMELGLDDNLLPKSVFRPEGDLNGDFVKEFVGWDDTRVIRTLCSKEETRAGQLMRALLERTLLKRILRYDESTIDNLFSQPLSGYIAVPPPEVVKAKLPEAEAKIAEAAGVEAHWVALLWENVQNPIASRLSLKIEDREIVLVDNNNKVRRFTAVSDIFQNAEFPSTPYVSLYARRPEGGFSEGQMEKIREATNSALKDVGTAAQAV